jgi:osmotically inducible protein OsmC
MQLSAVIAEAGGTPVALEVSADVTLRPDPAGGLHITTIALTVRGEVDGLDADGFRAAAENAKATCPVSKALTGTEITLDASLA